jgi:HD-GYP domain-containing protein (c-di-GMP phosphodiesterase class II)
LYLDEHWDGKGAPYRKQGGNIPILSRILCLAQTFEVFLYAFGLEEALDMAHARSGKWFDPEVVDACRSLAQEEIPYQSSRAPNWIDDNLPELLSTAADSDVDGICQAFAMIVDAKSSFTAEHSTRVMKYSIKLAQAFDFEQSRLEQLRRAALLHDIGKLGVSTSILEKPGKLDELEFDRVKLHPKLGQEVLSRIPGFEFIAYIAGSHHERLDGNGYWRGLGAEDLTLDVRIVTACDVFDALTAERPYRNALPIRQVFEIMESESGTAFDPQCLAALRENHIERDVMQAA